MKADGGCAFPSLEVYEGYDRDREEYVVKSDVATGMSLRDYFAAQLFPALLRAYLHDNKCGIGVEHAPRNVAAHAYAYADAMLAERSKS